MSEFQTGGYRLVYGAYRIWTLSDYRTPKFLIPTGLELSVQNDLVRIVDVQKRLNSLPFGLRCNSEFGLSDFSHPLYILIVGLDNDPG